MLYNKKPYQLFLLLGAIISFLIALYYGISELKILKSIEKISKQEQQEYNLAVDIIQSFSWEFQQDSYPVINNYLSTALITYPEFQWKYGSSIKILGRIPFYWKDQKIKAYEYILESNWVISGSIYEVWFSINPVQISRNLFFIPHFSVALALARATGVTSWNKYIHDGICVENTSKIYCLPEEKPSIKTIHEYIAISNGDKYSSLESNLMEYFGTGWFYSYWERGYVYFDPRTHRVFDPMPWSIMTYEMLK